MAFPKWFLDRYEDRLKKRDGSEVDIILSLENLDELMSVVSGFILEHIRLITITCYPEPKGEKLFLEYHFTDGPSIVSLKVEVPDEKVVPSLTPKLPAAGWAEREIMDLFDVKFEGHPDPARLIIPETMPRGVYLRT